ncbi:hypothetical protein ASD23_12860 [Agromyces sp. Root1464]|nr:hypothetical protein ASD23_12860 [Agromyces sp. Root1464]
MTFIVAATRDLSEAWKRLDSPPHTQVIYEPGQIALAVVIGLRVQGKEVCAMPDQSANERGPDTVLETGQVDSEGACKAAQEVVKLGCFEKVHTLVVSMEQADRLIQLLHSAGDRRRPRWKSAGHDRSALLFNVRSEEEV